MHDRAGVMLGDLDGRVRGGGGGATNEQRGLEPAPLHLFGDMHHLVERWSDQPREADDIRADLDGLVQNFVAGDHHAEVGDLEAVARKHDADDVFADVVHIALHGGDEEPAGRASAFGKAQGFIVTERGVFGLDCRDVASEVFRLFLFHVGGEPRDRLFHHACRLDHLWQEHLARAEEVADDAHAIHQRAFDDLEWSAIFFAGFFRVLVDEFVDASQQGMLEAFLDRLFAPRKVFFDFLAALALEALGEFEQTLGRVGPAVEQHILDMLEQFFRNLVVHFEHAGIDDAHVHARLAGVIEKCRVHRLAHGIVAAK